VTTKVIPPKRSAPSEGVPSLRTNIAGYVAPFVAFVSVMALERMLGLPLVWSYAVRLAIVSVLVAMFSLPYLSFRPGAPLASIGVGIAVFLIWIGPDLLFGYRHFWLFENSLIGSARTSIAPDLQTNLAFLTLRILGTSILVPIVEELFWRGWLMRWLIDQNFLTVPLGTYVPSAFWIVAMLFASEHGSYWEVGLAAGIIYNLWVIRTKNLADCILAHFVTNAILAAYVIVAGQWQYWL
jgi:CAAX prenyl protease-like protein